MIPTSPLSTRVPTPVVLLHGKAEPFCRLPAHQEEETVDSSNESAPNCAETESLPTSQLVAESNDVKDLQARLQRMSQKMARQERAHTAELARLRKENERLLSESIQMRLERDEARSKAQQYKQVARRMKRKVIQLNDSLNSMRKSIDTDMGTALEQTKSLMERLYLSDARRRDLEARFGTLARPSTNLKQKLASPRQSAIKDLSISKEGVSNAKAKYIPAAKVPPCIVVDPKHLDDAGFLPERNVGQRGPPFRPSSKPKGKLKGPRLKIRQIALPQFECSSFEDRLEPLLKPNELQLMRELDCLEGDLSATDN